MIYCHHPFFADAPGPYLHLANKMLHYYTFSFCFCSASRRLGGLVTWGSWLRIGRFERIANTQLQHPHTHIFLPPTSLRSIFTFSIILHNTFIFLLWHFRWSTHEGRAMLAFIGARPGISSARFEVEMQRCRLQVSPPTILPHFIPAEKKRYYYYV